MPVGNMDQLVAALVAGQRKIINKASLTSKGAGFFQSLWKGAGDPAAGASPPAFGAGSGYVPTRTTTGAFVFTNPTAPALTYLSRLSSMCSSPGMLVLYDRLWSCSGFSTVTTTAQSVVTPGTLPSGRDPNLGADVEPYIEVYTAPGATGATWTLTGTDAAGNANRTWTYTHPASAEVVGQFMQLLPGGGSPAAVLGCRVPVSFTASISSGTAGDVGFTLARRIAEIPLTQANVSALLDGLQLGLPQIYDDSCLAMVMGCTAASTGVLLGNLILGQN